MQINSWHNHYIIIYMPIYWYIWHSLFPDKCTIKLISLFHFSLFLTFSSNLNNNKLIILPNLDNQHVLLLFHGSLQLSFPQSWQIYMLVYKQYPEVSTNAVKWPQHQNDRIQGYHIVSTLCSNQNKWETHTCTHKYKTSNKYVSSFSQFSLMLDRLMYCNLSGQEK